MQGLLQGKDYVLEDLREDILIKNNIPGVDSINLDGKR